MAVGSCETQTGLVTTGLQNNVAVIGADGAWRVLPALGAPKPEGNTAIGISGDGRYVVDRSGGAPVMWLDGRRVNAISGLDTFPSATAFVVNSDGEVLGGSAAGPSRITWNAESRAD